MKKIRFIGIFFAIALLIAGICACETNDNATGGSSEPSYEIVLNTELPYTVEAGSEVDFTQYFIIKDQNGNRIVVTEEMLDLSGADTSEPGVIIVTCKLGKAVATANIIVTEKQTTQGGQGEIADIGSVLAKYADSSLWNFAVNFKEELNGETAEEYYEYLGDNVLNTYTDSGTSFTDYLGYDEEQDLYSYYSDNGDGTYEVYDETTDEFAYMYPNLAIVNFAELRNCTFTDAGNGKYSASDPNTAGAAVLGEYVGYSWTAFDLYIADEKITKIVGVMNDGDTQTFTLSKYNAVNFTLPSAGGDEPDPGDSGGTTTPEKEGFNPLTSPAAGTYYMGMLAQDGEYHYLTGEMAAAPAQYYMATVTDIADATKVTLAGDATSGWTLRCANGKYIEIELSGTHINAVYKTSSSMKWTWDAAEELFIWVNGSNRYFLGTHDTLTTVGGVDYDKYIGTNWRVVPGTYKAPSGGSTGGTGNVMEKQTYDPATFDKEDLQDKLLKTDGAIGLPSTGAYHALVVPVQFSGDTITTTQLENLRKAFNGTETDTGWESVSSYYKKASYGKLDLTFDIQGVFETRYAVSYYEQLSADDPDEVAGAEALLLEVLEKLQSSLTLEQYDQNGDECIDAVYLIYSAPVDYQGADFLWAYTTWTDSENLYDGLFPYSYLFAGLDFMDESTSRDQGSGADMIAGLKINASTYIHETGHLLGLDDYYDYSEYVGSDEGLGSADMMDYTVGDHNVYSKTMLGWLTPTIVTETTTVTLQPSVSNASAILIPLDFDNSYFSEYLMIDLYSATGLNALHAGMENSYLYDGAAFGVRVYHVSSSIDNPYNENDDYGSFTDCNNSTTAHPLIKLVEADGDKKFSKTNGWASESDLWQTGGKFSAKFPSYPRNDGKKLNFDIAFGSVSASSATVTVTYTY